MKKQKIQIFDYHDYRMFLRDWFEQAKQDEALSLRDIAAECGLSTGYLPMVLSGKRNLSDKALLKMQKSLKLNRDEALYLSQLIVLSDATEASDRLEAFEKIKKVWTSKQKPSQELDVFNYLSNWLNVAIREMAFRRDFQCEAEWISNRLVHKAPLKEVEKSISYLLNHGFLAKDSSGKIVPTEKQLNCFSGVFRLSLGEFHRQMFDLASKSIDLTPRDQRNLLGHTFLVPEDKVYEVRGLLDETLSKIQNLSSGFREAGPVYHVTLATFPVVKKDKD